MSRMEAKGNSTELAHTDTNTVWLLNRHERYPMITYTSYILFIPSSRPQSELFITRDEAPWLLSVQIAAPITRRREFGQELFDFCTSLIIIRIWFDLFSTF